jgi:hypothetical protein
MGFLFFGEKGIYLVKLTEMRRHLKDVGPLDSDGPRVIPREEILKMVRGVPLK